MASPKKTERKVARLLTIAMMKLVTNPMVPPFTVKVRKFSLGRCNLGGHVPLKGSANSKVIQVCSDAQKESIENLFHAHGVQFQEVKKEMLLFVIVLQT